MGAIPSVFLRVLCGSKWFLGLAAALLKLINHAIQIRIACAKASGEPVAAAIGNYLPISQDRKLAGFTGRNHGIDSEPLFNHGRETRDLGLVVPSSWAGTYLNFHSFLHIVGRTRPALSV
jgi:hypothetical protein